MRGLTLVRHMGRFVSAVVHDSKQNAGEIGPRCHELVALDCLAGVVFVWHQLEESLGHPWTRGMGTTNFSNGFASDGLVPDDARRASILVEADDSLPNGCGLVYLWMDSKLFQLAAGRDQP